jgi:hypothetical protein
VLSPEPKEKHIVVKDDDVEDVLKTTVKGTLGSDGGKAMNDPFRV